MSDAPAPLPHALPAAEPGDWSRPLAERRLAILSRLAEEALEVVVALKVQAKGGPKVVEGDVALAIDRVARALRQTLMLQERQEEALKDHEAGRAERRAVLAGSAARLVREAIEDEGPAGGRRVWDPARSNTPGDPAHHGAHDAAHDPAHDPERPQRLAREAAERLRGEAVGDLFVRPFGEAVAGICREVGLEPNWLRLAEDCLGVEESLAQRSRQGPGSAPGGAQVGAPGKARAPGDEDIVYDVHWLDSKGRYRPASSVLRDSS